MGIQVIKLLVIEIDSEMLVPVRGYVLPTKIGRICSLIVQVNNIVSEINGSNDTSILSVAAWVISMLND